MKSLSWFSAGHRLCSVPHFTDEEMWLQQKAKPCPGEAVLVKSDHESFPICFSCSICSPFEIVNDISFHSIFFQIKNIMYIFRRARIAANFYLIQLDKKVSS